ncbi:MAG TPA: ferritin-like domain-containing protein [Spirochaetia bacterium]|nr:ferritin-like domain-containing protein [Spirochaetia bacterium]
MRELGIQEASRPFREARDDETKHAERLIGRILFLEGTSVVSQLLDMHIGADVPAQLENDRVAEEGAMKAYSASICRGGRSRGFRDARAA